MYPLESSVFLGVFATATRVGEKSCRGWLLASLLGMPCCESLETRGRAGERIGRREDLAAPGAICHGPCDIRQCVRTNRICWRSILAHALGARRWLDAARCVHDYCILCRC